MKSSSRNTAPLAMTLFLAFAACGGENANAPSEGPTQTLQFAARMGALPFACGTSYALGSAATMVQLEDYRLFVSQLRSVDAAGKEVPLPLVPAGLWQDDNVALLDFENGAGPCSELGTKLTNTAVTVKGQISAGSALRFTLGVPAPVAHQNVGLAPPPLNLGAMFWSWQAGYKFMRVDFSTPSTDAAAASNQWLIHLGSTGCQSAAQTVAPAVACALSNRVEVTLPAYDPLQNMIVVDLAAVLANIDLQVNTPGTAPGCMSGATDPECQALFANLGLEASTGQCVNGCAAQKLFRLE